MLSISTILIVDNNIVQRVYICQSSSERMIIIVLLNVICCQKCGQMCGADSSVTDRQIEISSDWSLEFVLPIAVKDSLGFKRRLTLIFLAWLCDGWGTCLWFLKLAKIFLFIENTAILTHIDTYRFQGSWCVGRWEVSTSSSKNLIRTCLRFLPLPNRFIDFSPSKSLYFWNKLFIWL